MTVTRRALASALRSATQQSQRSAVIVNAAARDTKGAVANVEEQAAAISISIGDSSGLPNDVATDLQDALDRIATLEAAVTP
jgi:hypothetical protein